MAKKLLSLALVLCMVLSFTVAAFADTTYSTQTYTDSKGNTYTDVDSVTITKTYNLEGASDAESPAEKLTFDVKCTSVSDAEEGVTEDDTSIQIDSEEVNLEEGAAGGDDIEITFDLPDYTSVGKYTYSITESGENKAGVTYRAEKITMVVTVIQMDDGLLRVAAVKLYDEDNVKTTNFTENTYSAGKISISKTVTGTLGVQSKYFKFDITLNLQENKAYETLKVMGGATASTDANGETTYTVNTEGVTMNIDNDAHTATATIYLKHGDTAYIENVPYGVTYVVDEETVEGYDVTVAGDVTSDGATGTVDNATEELNYTNTKGGDPDTGISLDTIPYIALLLIATAGLAVVLTRKRTNED